DAQVATLRTLGVPHHAGSAAVVAVCHFDAVTARRALSGFTPGQMVHLLPASARLSLVCAQGSASARMPSNSLTARATSAPSVYMPSLTRESVSTATSAAPSV